MWSCIAHSWSPGIGDPDTAAWAAAAAYALAAFAALLAALRGVAKGRERLFWLLAGLVLALLALNKQLDMQTLLRGIGRCATQGSPIEGARFAIKELVILSLPVLASAALWGGWRLLRGTLARTWLALVGFVCIAAFVVIRAAWLADIYLPVAAEIGQAGLTHLLEFPGPLLVLAAAIRASSRSA